MFRRSGSAVTFFVDGKIPTSSGDEFTSALAGQRFRTIETAASEEVSMGWVTSGDPTGDSFEHEDLDLDEGGVWLRVRFDKKKLPMAWLAIHRSVAERSAGRKLSARERRDLKQDLCEQLLPRTLPSVQFVDALWLPKRGRVMLFTTSQGVREEFEKLFFKTFGVPLEVATPHSLATHAGLGREQLAYLDEVAPVAWPKSEGGRGAGPLRSRRTRPSLESNDGHDAAPGAEAEAAIALDRATVDWTDSDE